MTRLHLNRRLTLESETRTPDGAGGFVSVWQALGTLWATLEPASGREGVGFEQVETVLPVKVTVRAAPMGDPARPEAGQRFREVGRSYRIQAVTERDRRGLYLTCHATEEARP